MASITTRAGKGSPLTNAEVDANFTNLNTELGQKLVASDLSPYLTSASAASTYQALDADLTAIAGLAGTSGFLKKTAANTWTLDTNAYLTGNQTITFSGDASGSGSTSVSLTLASSGVSAGTYTNATITVDAKGRVTSASSGSGGGVTSFNTRTGAVTLASSDVTTALGYTPINPSNAIFTANPQINSGTSDGILFLNAGRAVTSGTALTWDGSSMTLKTFSGGYLNLDSTSAGTSNTITSLLNNSAAYALLNIKASEHVFQIGSTEKMRLNTSGNLVVVGSISSNGNNVLTTASTYSGTLTSSQVTTALGFTPLDDAGDTMIGLLGLGNTSSPLAYIDLRGNKGPTNGTVLDGFSSAFTASDVSTTSATAFTSFIGPGAGVDLTSLTHYAAAQRTFSGTATTQTGFEAASSMVSATNNYGFRGRIASGTGRWNLYMDGSASNYLAGRLGIGSQTINNENLRIGSGITGAVSVQSLLIDGAVQSDATTRASYYRTVANTQAASFTLSNLYHYEATQNATFGAGSTVTTQVGFRADSTMTGAGTNIGFRGAIPQGSNRWNLYMDGTAANFIGGFLILNSALGFGSAGSPSYGTAGQFLKTNGSASAPTWGDLTSSEVTTALGFTPISANQTITVSGDASGSGSTSISLTLANSGVTAGTYGSATNIPQIVVDAKGRVTSVTDVAVSIPSGSLTFTGDVTGTGSTGSSTTLTLANTAVTAGTYTNATITVDAKGRVTSASSGTGGGITISDDTSTNSTRYITFEDATSGSSSSIGVSSTKLTFNPSTGLLFSTGLSFNSFTETIYALSGTSPFLSAANGTIQTWTLSGNSSPTDSLGNGQSILLMIDDGTAYTITWPSVTWKSGGGSAPTLNTSGLTVISLWKVGGVLYGARIGDA